MTLRDEAFINGQYQKAKINHRVWCRCGEPVQVVDSYKCLYCKEFFCKTCAEKHFGETVESREKYFKYLESQKQIGVDRG